MDCTFAVLSRMFSLFIMNPVWGVSLLGPHSDFAEAAMGEIGSRGVDCTFAVLKVSR